MNNRQKKLKLQVGDQFPTYNGLYDVKKSVQAQIVHQEGEVIALYIWSTGCCHCYDPLSKYQNMLETNTEKWSNKVRFIALCEDHDNAKVNNAINDYKWDRITHLRFRSFKHPIYKDIKFNWIPFLVLVNKEGVICYKGSSSDIEMEQTINNILEGVKEQPVIFAKKEKIVLKRTFSSLENKEQQFIYDENEPFIKKLFKKE